MKSNGGGGCGGGNGSTVSSMTNASDTVDVVGSTAEKHLGIGEGASLKKHSKKVDLEQAMDASGSTTRPPLRRGKSRWRSRRPPS
ncbi:hypothetical protein B296_00034088 [Ensete ventricosum]|uniref:Uncharacterized protein n=1 Tax=Ensete ventricosum TaxID=4639 RepID=A0A426Z5Y7_ENSVE|nr:hypothetical protein B296_00034088 [Ensete ventricosum]